MTTTTTIEYHPAIADLTAVPFVPAHKRTEHSDEAYENQVSACLCCDAPLSQKALDSDRAWVEMTWTGHLIPPGHELSGSEEWSQGCHPVDTRCKRQIPKALRFTQKTEKR
jgi:hypothetical protein